MRDRSLHFPTSLWMPICAPILWALHFLLSYTTVAIVCARIPDDGANGRVLVAAYTLAALAGMAALGVQGWRRRGDADPTRRFLGGLTVGLAALSACATLVVALPAAFFASCR